MSDYTFPEFFYKLIDNQTVKFTLLSPHPTEKNYAFYIYKDIKAACFHIKKLGRTYKSYDAAIDADVSYLESLIDLLKYERKCRT